MDEPRIKRLVWTVVISLIVILLLKSVLLKTANKVAIARENKKAEQARMSVPASAPAPVPAPLEAPPPAAQPEAPVMDAQAASAPAAAGVQ